MILNFTARHAQITPDIKEYCQKRIKSLEKILGSSIETDIILSVEKYRNKAEINIKSRRISLNAAEETQDMMTALGGAFDNLENRIKKEIKKLRERKRRKNREKEVLPSVEREEQAPRIIKSNDYSLKPMSLEEALLQFNLSQKDVLAFRKIGTEKWAFIYRRKDGNYGLIEPE